MKNVIKTTAVILTVMLLSSVITMAQEHNHMHSDKSKDKTEMHNLKSFDKNNDGVVYECPMKCEAPSDKPGECSKCGMNLKKISLKSDAKSFDKNNDGFVYECPMKCEAPSDKPGECSKCGMNLKKISVEKSNGEMTMPKDKCCENNSKSHEKSCNSKK